MLHNGVPLAKARVTLASDSHWEQATTDADGRFRVTVRAGEHALSWQQPGERMATLRAVERAAVVRGQRTVQMFQIHSATLRVRLLDADGQPVAGVPIELRDAADVLRGHLPATGADGVSEQEVEPGAMTAFVLPKRLQGNEAVMQVIRDHPGNKDPFAGLRIRLGPVAAGESKPIELRLPPEWAR